MKMICKPFGAACGLLEAVGVMAACILSLTETDVELKVKIYSACK